MESEEFPNDTPSHPSQGVLWTWMVGWVGSGVGVGGGGNENGHCSETYLAILNDFHVFNPCCPRVQYSVFVYFLLQLRFFSIILRVTLSAFSICVYSNRAILPSARKPIIIGFSLLPSYASPWLSLTSPNIPTHFNSLLRTQYDFPAEKAKKIAQTRNEAIPKLTSM